MGFPEASEAELWGFALVVEGACETMRFYIILLLRTLPQSPHGDSSLPEGASKSCNRNSSSNQNLKI